MRRISALGFPLLSIGLANAQAYTACEGQHASSCQRLGIVIALR
jgi:hypothetical protein